MDPFTQGALGAVLPAALARRRRVRVAAAVGFPAGMAADLDVLIRSQTDPLLFLEYHRQFTHSLLFVPIGGLLVAAAIHLLLRRWTGIGFKETWFYATLGYATHGLLDAATSYGTLLLWPFDDARVAFDVISIVDPLFTLPIALLLAVGAVRRSPGAARLAVVWAALYVGAGTVQREAAEAVARDLARERGHEPVRLTVKPSFANLVVWRSIYEADGRFHVDAVRPWFSRDVIEGASVATLDVPEAFPWLDPSSRQARDIERFSWFSDGWVAKADDGGDRVIDVRYAFLPMAIAPLWSIRLDRDAPPADHVRFETHREGAGRRLRALVDLILGRE